MTEAGLLQYGAKISATNSNPYFYSELHSQCLLGYSTWVPGWVWAIDCWDMDLYLSPGESGEQQFTSENLVDLYLFFRYKNDDDKRMPVTFAIDSYESNTSYASINYDRVKSTVHLSEN